MSPPPPQPKKSKIGLILGIVLGVVVLLAISIPIMGFVFYVVG